MKEKNSYYLPVLILIQLFLVNPGFSQELKFTEVSQEAGIDYIHNYQEEIDPVHYRVSAGLACGDYNNDGYPDLYIEVGDTGRNLLFRNNRNGTFTECSEEVGLNLTNWLGGCPFFMDYDNDGWLDLFLGGLEEEAIRVFHNEGALQFEEVMDDSFLGCDAATFSFSAGDYNKDGYLDLFLSHWNIAMGQNHIWKNQSGNSFENTDSDLGYFNPFGDTDYSFSGNFTDFNNDSWPDLLIASDFGTSQVWLNQSESHYEHISDPSVIDDENGMGSAIGDYNNDGWLDWFVSSVYDSDGVTEGNWGASGNRLYKNNGNNTFEEVGKESGVDNGSWGWGASFADLNNDGFLDIVHTNGWPRGSDQFYADTTRIFISNQDGTFRESALACGMIDTLQGRGLTVFDYDKDGDLDIFIANYRNRPSLWRNDLESDNHFLSVKLQPKEGLTAIGSKVTLFIKGQQQIRELRCGSNYNSQNPLELHFGLGKESIIDSLLISWPDGSTQKQFNVQADQFLNINQKLELPGTNEIHVFPNPFDEQIKIFFQNNLSGTPIKLNLFNLEGKLISTNSSYIESDGIIYFDWNLAANGIDLPSSIYYIQIIQGVEVLATHAIVKL